MRILCKEQGTPEWHRVKRGVISASNARLALAGKHTKGRKRYIEHLADDQEGLPDFDTEEPPPWFIDGRYYESWARGWYSFTFDVDVDETGFVVHDEYSWIGCSPDGLIGDDGLLEIKYRKTLKTFKEHAALRANKSVIDQVQTQLFVTGRKWCDYVNYWRSDDHDKEKGLRERIEREQAYIDNTLLPAFISLWRDTNRLVESRKRMYVSS